MKVENRDGIVWATFDRPEALNAFDIPDLEELLALFGNLRGDDDCRVLVLTGAARAFSVGADIKAMERMTDAAFARAASLYQELARAARDLDKPVIGAINGYALGGGLEIALMCDLRIAARSAMLGLPDAELGFSPTGGLTYLLVRMVGLTRALDMALSAEMVSAEDSERIGLVSRVVDDDDLLSVTEELAARIAAFPTTGVRNIRRSFYSAAESSFETALDLEEGYDSECFQSADTQASLRAFIDARKNKKK